MATATKTRTGSDRPSYRDEAGNVDPEKAQAALDGVVTQIREGSLDTATGVERLEHMLEDLNIGRVQVEHEISLRCHKKEDDSSLRRMMRRMAALIKQAKDLIAEIRDRAGLTEPIPVGA